ncbi:MAG TPA: hypothetical protein VF420_10375 [Casimicrobiaceae bacterium]
MSSVPVLLRDVFAPAEGAASRSVTDAGRIERHAQDVESPELVLDRFRDAGGALCCFLRLTATARRNVDVVLDGGYGTQSCPSGGWLLRPSDAQRPSYWIPLAPVLRARDANGRIIAEETAPVSAFLPGALSTTIVLEARGGLDLECVVWCLPPAAERLVEELQSARVLERQPLFMLSSHFDLRGPSDLYRCLIHGTVYENRFEPLRKRKIASELEAYSLYVAMHGLEAATGKKLYWLLKQQLLRSVLARQGEDGRWHHGEWTDFMETHYRLHNGAMLLLEAALEERSDPAVAQALRRAADALARAIDRTDIGVWFFHDSLEESVEMTERSGIRWVPSRELGKSPTTKMILNSHLDAIVTLDRYRQVTGDDQHAAQVESALSAAHKLLALRPAERLYGILYWAVWLTLKPEAEAKRLPLPLRAVKRLARRYLLPELHRVKRRWPRMVMPGGLIERHLSRLHFGVNYHSVNVMDLARVQRRFPGADFADLLRAAVGAVSETSLATYWAETRQRQAIGYWVEALFQWCTLGSELERRADLAVAMLAAVDAGLGLPPSLLGAHPEVVAPAMRYPCPSPRDDRLRVANLSRGSEREILVVNPAATAIELVWEDATHTKLRWVEAGGRVVSAGAPMQVPPRGWLLGRSGAAAEPHGM